MKYRSSLHAAYAAYLSALVEVESFDYMKAILPWQDGFSGRWHRYFCHFRAQFKNGRIEHIQVAPLSKQMPLIKYLYAENQLENWRWITKEELIAIQPASRASYRHISFDNQTLSQYDFNAPSTSVFLIH